MFNLTRQQLIAAYIIVAVALLGTVALMIKSASHGQSGEVKFIESTGNPAESGSADQIEQKPALICVHIAGKVKSPGVYELSPGSRVVDAVKAAGGTTANADQDNINLAEKLTDGAQVFIAAKGTVPPTVTSCVRGGSPSTHSSSPAVFTSKPASAEKRDEPGKLTTPGSGTVNINTACSEELQRLPGVGPSMAQRIIDYRTQNGPFHTIDELDEVKGIGPTKIAKMRPFVSF